MFARKRRSSLAFIRSSRRWQGQGSEDDAPKRRRKKLYAVRDARGRFKDRQTYERSHRADLAQKSKAEITKAKKKAARKAARKKVVRKVTRRKAAKKR